MSLKAGLDKGLQYGLTGAASGNPYVGAAMGLYGLATGAMEDSDAKRIGMSLMTPDLEKERLQTKSGPDTTLALRNAIHRGNVGGAVPKYNLGEAYRTINQVRSEEEAKRWAQRQAQLSEQQKLGAQMIAGAESDAARIKAAEFGTEGAWYNDPTVMGEALAKLGKKKNSTSSGDTVPSGFDE